jgi:hypothetical protein
MSSGTTTDPLDCCDEPSAHLILLLLEDTHNHERVLLCRCGQHWFDRFQEDVDWSGGGDRMHSWLTRITEDEVDALTAAHTSKSAPDLDFLVSRPAIYIGPGGKVSTTTGAPAGPWPPR